MLLISDLSLVDDLSGNELKVLLVITRMIVVFNQEPPTNKELAKACGMSESTFKKVRISLEDKGLILRRPTEGGRTDYKITTNGVGGIVGAAEGQRRRENPPEEPTAPAPPPSAKPKRPLPPTNRPVSRAPKEDDLTPLEPVTQTSKGEGYKTILLTDREFMNSCAMKHQKAVYEIEQLLGEFTNDKIILSDDTWPGISQYKRNFFFWLNKRLVISNGTYTHKARQRSRRGLNDNGQIISADEANGVLQRLVNDGS